MKLRRAIDGPIDGSWVGRGERHCEVLLSGSGSDKRMGEEENRILKQRHSHGAIELIEHQSEFVSTAQSKTNSAKDAQFFVSLLLS